MMRIFTFPFFTKYRQPIEKRIISITELIKAVLDRVRKIRLIAKKRVKIENHFFLFEDEIIPNKTKGIFIDKLAENMLIFPVFPFSPFNPFDREERLVTFIRLNNSREDCRNVLIITIRIIVSSRCNRLYSKIIKFRTKQKRSSRRTKLIILNEKL